MGFSPSDFTTRDGKRFHFELKDGPRIVLWTDDEMVKVLDISMVEARCAFDQLRTLIQMIDGNSD